MKRTPRTCLIVLAVILLLVENSPAGMAQENLVEVDLVSDVTAIQPGKKFWVGIRMQVADGWHVNWLNPGDAGLAPTVQWKLPQGFEVDDIQWPYPTRYALPGLSIFGYENEVYLLCQVTPPATMSKKDAVLIAHVDWLACREACIPGKAVLELNLQVADQTPTVDKRWRDVFTRVRETFPVDPSPWKFTASLNGNAIVITAMPPENAGTNLTALTFFPVHQGIIENAAAQALTNRDGAYFLEIARDRMAVDTPERLRGVIVSQQGWNGVDHKAAMIDVPLKK